jgi:hypothetical protein
MTGCGCAIKEYGRRVSTIGSYEDGGDPESLEPTHDGCGCAIKEYGRRVSTIGSYEDGRRVVTKTGVTPSRSSPRCLAACVPLSLACPTPTPQLFYWTLPLALHLFSHPKPCLSSVTNAMPRLASTTPAPHPPVTCLSGVPDASTLTASWTCPTSYRYSPWLAFPP